MLDSAVLAKIEKFVQQKPRSVHEVAQSIGKNWRTADRYVEYMKENFGTVETRIFREGTRGALKIVYAPMFDKINSNSFQEHLEETILRSKQKYDFSAFDIFQFIPDREKEAVLNPSEAAHFKASSELLSGAKKEVLVFSGNLSFLNTNNSRNDLLPVFESLVERKIRIKVLSRVDFAGRANIEKALALNRRLGTDLIEIRHREQPVRAFLADMKSFQIKEVKEPTGKRNELDQRSTIYYTIWNREWAEWMGRVFWKMFNSSIDAKKRLAELDKIKR